MQFPLSRGEQSRTNSVVSKAGQQTLRDPMNKALFWISGARMPKRQSRRLFVLAGERRRRASSLQFAAPPVATRNGLAPPARIGAPQVNEAFAAISTSFGPGSCIACRSNFRQATNWQKPLQTPTCPALLTTKNSCFENYAAPLRYGLAVFGRDVHTWASRSGPSATPCQRTHT